MSENVTPTPAVPGAALEAGAFRLQELRPGAQVRGILADRTVTIVNVAWHSDSALTLTYRDEGGNVVSRRVERELESQLELVGQSNRATELTRSKRRVADHGEVFTPAWLVDQMLNLVQNESERIDSRVLEPACGSGNFLVPVLGRKLITVHRRYGRSDFERRHQALLGLMCLYGIELLEDNAHECRANLLDLITNYLAVDQGDDWYVAAQNVLEANIIHGDALSMTIRGESQGPITFPEWAYLGKGRYHRRDFRFDTLAQRSSFGEGTLFGDLAMNQIFTPSRDYGDMSVRDIAARKDLGD